MSKKVILITDDQIINETVKNVSTTPLEPKGEVLIISLPHPVYLANSSFMYSNGNFYEINQIEHPDPKSNPHTWFLGHSILSDGTLYTATPVDPIFLAYPFIEKECKRSHSEDGCFINLEHILSQNATNSTWTNYIATALLSNPNKLERLFDYIYINVNNESLQKTIQIRHNPRKFLQWLQGRVASVSLALASIPSIAPGYFFTEHGKQQVKYETFSHKYNRDPKNPALALISKHSSILIQIALDYISKWISQSNFEILLNTYRFEDLVVVNTYSQLSLKELQNNLRIVIGGENKEDDNLKESVLNNSKENNSKHNKMANNQEKIISTSSKSNLSTKVSKKATTAPQGNASILSF